MTGGGNSTLSLAFGKTVSFTYGADSARRTKTADGKTTIYHYNNGLLLSETSGNDTLRYYYDSNGSAVSIGSEKNGKAEEVYALVYNGQGDVTAICRKSDGRIVGTYEYDLWGKIVSVNATSYDTQGITKRNPIRYRSYYYDTETGLYYLNARYYDAGIRRFINADKLILEQNKVTTGYNLYAYCNNNAANRKDPSGRIDTASMQHAKVEAFAFLITGIYILRQKISAETTELWATVVSSTSSLVNGILYEETESPADEENNVDDKKRDETDSKRQTANQKALHDLAKEVKKAGGVDEEDADTLLNWAEEVGTPHHGPESHSNRPAPTSQNRHIHIGNIGHIPVN